MQVDVIETDGVTVMVIEGRVDSTTANSVGQVLNEALAAGATRLVIDLEAVDYVSSAGLREFVAALKKVNQKDGDLRLASPSERVRDVLELTGLASVFAVCDTRSDAVSSF